jgi:hypothetical protein
MNRKQNKKRIAGQKESLAKRRWIYDGADLIWDLLWVCWSVEIDEVGVVRGKLGSMDVWRRCEELTKKAFYER